MAISSPLNPSTIVKERPTTALAAQNFITGGSPLGQGVVASAANKIVGFQRGAAGVAAQPPDLSSIIQTLSTNILNNVESRVQSINQNVSQIVNKTIGDLGGNYKQRLDQIDAARPNSILQNFLNLYKEALGYIQFLGNRKNIRTLGENLKSLQNVFTETFNIAKIIRQTIVKIVNQLSNLPTATAGGGGLNLDVNVPGGGLKRSAPTGLMRMMRRRPGMMLGGAALAGGLGSQVVSGMMDVGGEVQAAPMAEGTIPSSLLDRFNGILDRFSAAINSLSTVKRSQPSSGGGGGGTTPPPAKDKSGGGGGGAGGTVTATGSEQQKTEALIAGEEGVRLKAYKDSGGVPTIGYGETKGVRLGDTITKEKAVVRLRSSIESHRAVAIKQVGAEKWNKLDENTKAVLTSVAYNYGSLPDRIMPAVKTGDSEKIAQSLSVLHGDNGGILKARREREAGFIRTGSSPKLDKDFLAGGKLAAPGTTTPTLTAATTSTQQTASTVAAAQTQATNAQQVAQSVSRPPTQQPAQVTVAPMNMASPQTQSTPAGGKSIPPPQMAKGGVSVPFLTSSNDDNFLTLYSKLVYNIVDG